MARVHKGSRDKAPLFCLSEHNHATRPVKGGIGEIN